MSSLLWILAFSVSLASADSAKPVALAFSDKECMKSVATKRAFPGQKESIEKIIQAFFAGPNRMEIALGMKGPSRETKSLYRGFLLKGGKLVLKFDMTAEDFLNGTPCRRQTEILPLEQMLLKIPGIKVIGYEVDGKPFRGGDA